jgi:hypothetical protein
MNKKIIQTSFKDFDKNYWDELVVEFGGNIFYTVWFLKYINLYAIDNQSENHSFVLEENNEVIALVPLFIETINGQKQISCAENSVFSPLFNNKLTQKKVRQYFVYILKLIDNLNEKYSLRLARFQISSFLVKNNPTFYTNNYYLLDQYQDKPSLNWYINKAPFSYIVDIKNITKAKIRKSFKQFINLTDKKTNLIVLDGTNYNKNIFDKYVQTHYQLKGNNRSLENFKMDYEAIKSGKQVILICENKNVFLGVIVLYLFNNQAVYNSGMQDYDLCEIEKLYPTHYLMWQGIEYLKSIQCNDFFVGEQVANIFNPSEKEKGISHFKAGWGGDLYPWNKAEKIFNE